MFSKKIVFVDIGNFGFSAHHAPTKTCKSETQGYKTKAKDIIEKYKENLVD